MIFATKSGDTRVASLDSIVAMEMNAGGGRLTSLAGLTPVNGKGVVGLPAANLAIRIASGAVAKRTLSVWRGEADARQRVTTTWQSRLFARRPNDRDSWFLLMEMTEASLTARNNAYWVKVKDAGTVSEVHLKHPDVTEARWNRATGVPEYRFQQPDNQWGDWLGPDAVLHFRVGYPHPGCIVAPTPIELHRSSLGASLAKFETEESYHREGLAKGVAVTFPKEVKPEQARLYREALAQEVGGSANTGKVRVFGGGATVQTIGLTLQDAEFVESKKLSAREVAQIFGVPATLLDIGDAAQKPLTPEHEESRWNRHFLEPRLARIQEAIKADSDFFGPGASFYPAFAEVIVRADFGVEAAAEVADVQAGILLPDEARAKRGLGPLPGGVGMIPQITPVGGAPNPGVAAADPYAGE